MNEQSVLRDDLKNTERLRITEIFCSLQGEAQHAGWPTTFIRLTGCPLRCQYCDTAYAFHGGTWFDYQTILSEVKRFGVPHVCVTGGEPLSQKNVLGLITLLCEAGYQVSLETSGAVPIEPVDQRCIKVLDIKTPGSGEHHRNLLENLSQLNAKDQVKFVICDRADYDWALKFVDEHQLTEICTVWFSASHQQLAHRQLADWLVADSAPVRFQMQLHKLLWNDQPGT